jgi:Ca2+/Na+ antiporter
MEAFLPFFKSKLLNCTHLLLYLMILMVTTFIVINTIMHDKKINRIEGAALICFFIAFIVQLGNIYSLFTVDTSSNENILFPDF